MAEELTHCGSCGRKLRAKKFRALANEPEWTRWLGHRPGGCSDTHGPTATAQQIKEAKAAYKARTGKDWP
jgi:hypothetical protein